MPVFENLALLFSDPAVWGTLLALSAMEIVLGIDNLVLIAILSDKLPPAQRPMARRLGLIFALVTRILLLSLVFMISTLVKPVFDIMGHSVSWRDILLFAGGAFLLFKAWKELAEELSPHETTHKMSGANALALVIVQIGFMDIVFSFDSVMTAIGLADNIEVMILAVLAAMAVMLFAVDWVSNFISNNPSIKVLALCYMLLIGVTLVAESIHMHIPKPMVYSAMAFSFFVEMINWYGRKRKAHMMLERNTAAGKNVNIHD